MTILETAQAVVYGDREAERGHPEKHYHRVALLWEAYLVGKMSAPLHSEDVLWMLALMKIGRAMGSDNIDNLVDAAGYVALVERVRE